MIAATAIGFVAVVIIALILIHCDNQRIIKHHQSEIQRQIDRLKKIK